MEPTLLEARSRVPAGAAHSQRWTDNARTVKMSRLMVLTGVLLGGCAVDMEEKDPEFLLIAHERLRPGSEEAYDKNELQLATVCATLKCPHPYLALATVTGPKEVWWLNAFASQEERDGLDASYASNEPLITAMRPLGKRKEDFRESFTSTMTEFRRDLSKSALRIGGARFLVITRPLSMTLRHRGRVN
jgi:hypothetical protein